MKKVISVLLVVIMLTTVFTPVISAAEKRFGRAALHGAPICR